MLDAGKNSELFGDDMIFDRNVHPKTLKSLNSVPVGYSQKF